MSAYQYTLEQLVDILGFKVEVMNQTLLVSTLMAVLAMTVAAVLLAVPDRSRLRAWLLSLSIIGTLIFVLGTMVNVIILPGMKRNLIHPVAGQIRGLLMLSSAVVWDLLVGTLVLFVVIGALGFVYSRRIGYWTLASAAVILIVFLACCVFLDRIMLQ